MTMKNRKDAWFVCGVPIYEVCRQPASIEPCPHSPPWLNRCYNGSIKDESRFDPIPLWLRHHGPGNTKYYVRPPERTFLQNNDTDLIKPDEERQQEEKRDDGV